jgi:hypothetical protein
MPTRSRSPATNPRSVVYATYDLLETFGCVFVAHDYDYVPRKTETTSPSPGDYDKTDAPFFYALRSRLGRRSAGAT